MKMNYSRAELLDLIKVWNATSLIILAFTIILLSLSYFGDLNQTERVLQLFVGLNAITLFMFAMELFMHNFFSHDAKGEFIQ